MRLIHVSGRVYDLFHDNTFPTGFEECTRFEVDHNYKNNGRVHWVSGMSLNAAVVKKIQRGLEFGVHSKEI